MPASAYFAAPLLRFGAVAAAGASSSAIAGELESSRAQNSSMVCGRRSVPTSSANSMAFRNPAL